MVESRSSKVKRKGAGQKPAPVAKDAIFLRVPETLGSRLAIDAEKAGKTEQAVVLGILADHYGIEVAAPRRGKPKRVESE